MAPVQIKFIVLLTLGSLLGALAAVDGARAPVGRRHGRLLGLASEPGLCDARNESRGSS